MVSPHELKLDDHHLPARVATLLDAPAELLLPERLLLYALVRGLRPARCLEIGSHFGGSTSIMCSALDDVGAGALVCVDPDPLVPTDVWATVMHRATMVQGHSPDALREARERVDDAFDFVFIDGDHTRDAVIRDVEGVLHHVTDGAHLLFHDCHYWEVRDAIDRCIERSRTLLDCGTLSTSSTEPIAALDGSTARWGGFRMLRVMNDLVGGHDR